MASEKFSGGLQLERKALTWKIVNFSYILTSDDLISRQKIKFQAGSSIGRPTKWSFYLKPESGSCPRGDKAWVAAFLQLLEKPENVEEVLAQCTLQITGSPKVFESGIKNFICEDPLSWGWSFHHLIDRNSDISTLPLTDEAIFISLNLTLSAPVPEMWVWDIQQEKDFESMSVEHFIQDLKENYFDLTDPDVLFISKDKVEIASDRRMLSARSPFFRKMFQPEMAEPRVLTIEFDDLSGLTLEVLNVYLCTGELVPEWKRAIILEELVYGANKFQLDHLSDFLENNLAKVCTKENAKNLAALAGKLGMKKAEQDLIENMKRNATSVEELPIGNKIEKRPDDDGFELFPDLIGRFRK